MKLKKVVIWLVVLAAIFSCSTPYDDELIEAIKSNPIRLKPMDQISIIVNCREPQIAAMFNLPYIARRIGETQSLSSSSGNVGNLNTSNSITGYTVDPFGYIDFPVIGKIYVQGLTRSEATEHIKNLLIQSNQVKDPVVTIEFMNLGFSVLGEVSRPGRYRQTTVEVDSFAPNPWGLYNMHGNVNEWCWDYYGAYDPAITDDPTGAEGGTRRVYRGGGWNDFGKNLRSAYRAAGELNMASYNLGIRLVRSAGKTLSGTVSTSSAAERTQTSGKMLIAYFSWSGNTQGVAQEIQRQTGADIFEIMPIPAYSDDYNTVLMEAQRDQHDQARPAIANLPQSIDEYDVILLGYPNWWASIPMPIATFLESYDFTGKTILPFCSHGGGRFGQSLTAIAKLAPQVIIAPGLSVHYSGGSSLTGDVRNWLESQGIQTIQ